MKLFVGKQTIDIQGNKSNDSQIFLRQMIDQKILTNVISLPDFLIFWLLLLFWESITS